MKKIFLTTLILLLIACKTTQTTSSSSKIKKLEGKKSKEIIETEDISSYQIRNDFSSVSEKATNVFLNENKATSKTKSVLILTQGFKGGKVIVKQNGKTLYTEYPISHLKMKYADKITFDNTADLEFYDSYSKETIIIKSQKLEGKKFVYLMKVSPTTDKPIYKITISDKLRPLKQKSPR